MRTLALPLVLLAGAVLTATLSCGGGGSAATRTDPPAGTLDATFGSGGLALTALGASPAWGNSVTVQGDGKLVVAGAGLGPGSAGETDFAVVRYAPDGTLDPSFDGDGIAYVDFGGDEVAVDVLVDPAGRILVLGSTTALVPPNDTDFALARLTPAGAPDTTFDGDGKVTTDVSGNLSSDDASGIALQADGRIVACGATHPGTHDVFALVRYGTEGTLDATFGTGGIVHTDAYPGQMSIPRAVAVQADQKLVVGGLAATSSGQWMLAARYGTTGALDATFGTGGIATIDCAPSEASHEAHALALLPGGQIVLGGAAYLGGNVNYAFKAVRLTAAGVLDTAFGTGGHARVGFGPGDCSANAVLVDAQGRIFLAGHSTDTPNHTTFTLVRYTTAGVLDASFGGDGSLSIPLGSDSSRAYGAALQADGKIVAVGYGQGVGQNIALVRVWP